MTHKGTKTLETARLDLRRFCEGDILAAYRNWTSSDAVTKFLRWPTHRTIETIAAVLRNWIDSYADPAFYHWAIVPRDLDEPIGTISVVSKNEKTKTVHIGYCIGEAWWQKGYMSEALAAVIAYFFGEVGVLRIESQHDPQNPASGRVMQKCGMRYEGTLRQADWSNRGIVDACMYSLLAAEYEQKRGENGGNQSISESIL